MKRVLSILAAMVMILAAVPTLGEDLDPIVGTWYVSVITDDRISVITLTFDNMGYVSSEIVVIPTNGEKSYRIGPTDEGAWGIKGSYIYFVGSSQILSRAPIYVLGDKLYAPMTDDGYWVLTRMPCNYMNDIYIPNDLMDTVTPYIK